MKVAVLAVHGVIPQRRYEFQDDVAAALSDRLTRFANQGTWRTTVVFPVMTSTDDPVGNEASTIVRVHRETESAEKAVDAFDVHEAYWSPIDKGKTTFASVLGWLLRTVFLPFNDTARYMERPEKVVWDVGFILTAIVLGAAFFAGSFGALAWALGRALQIVGCSTPLPAGQLCQLQALSWSRHWPFLQADYGTAWDTLMHPMSFFAKAGPYVVFALLLGAIGAFLFVQGLRATWSIAKNAGELLRDPIQFASRIVATVMLLMLALAAIIYCVVQRVNGIPLSYPALALVVSFLALNAGRGLLVWFIANFFGDVQIYTTRDENSEFFTLRKQILELVTRNLLTLIDSGNGKTAYEHVYILAHSLGSTIAMDAILHLHTLSRETVIAPADLARIRGFVTFGTALEKTKYFFNAWSPTLSQQFQEWRDDLYGVLFTADHDVLTKPNDQGNGIYWLNCWNFSDFVSDRICSYRSVVRPGEALSNGPVRRAQLRQLSKHHKVAFAGRLVAKNRWRFGPFAPWALHFVTHSDYVNDDWFWHDHDPSAIAALDVVTSAFTWSRMHDAGRTTARSMIRTAQTQKAANMPAAVQAGPGDWKEVKKRGLGFTFWTNDVLK
jgi:hypothetical protein